MGRTATAETRPRKHEQRPAHHAGQGDRVTRWQRWASTGLWVGCWLTIGLAWGCATAHSPSPPVATSTAADEAADEAELVFIPAGEFTMGHPDSYDTQPVRRVSVPAFYIDKHEVTNERYQRFIEATGHKVPWSLEAAAEPYKWDWQTRTYPAGKADHPVVLVSWEDAKAFCAWAGKRLPTEAQWEKAARGVTGKAYPWGNGWRDTQANTMESGVRQTSPVGSFAADVSEYGVHDLAGNVSEWVEEWFVMYPGNTFTNYDAGEKYKILRGGSWDYFKSIATGYHRQYALPHSQMTSIGFRCVTPAAEPSGTRAKAGTP